MSVLIFPVAVLKLPVSVLIFSVLILIFPVAVLVFTVTVLKLPIAVFIFPVVFINYAALQNMLNNYTAWKKQLPRCIFFRPESID